jgi:hypothetical protein
MTSKAKKNINKNSLANLRPAKKGEVRNPHGRPVGGLAVLLQKEIEKICPGDKQGRTWKELIVIATMTLAMKGNATALKEIWERMEGKVTQPVSGPDGGPVQLEYVNDWRHNAGRI